MHIYGGDDRIINNIFVGQSRGLKKNLFDLFRKNKCAYGTDCYEGYRYSAENKNLKNKTLPVTACNNIYFNGAKSRSRENNSRIIFDFKADIRVAEENGHYYFYSHLGDILSDGFTATRLQHRFWEVPLSRNSFMKTATAHRIRQTAIFLIIKEGKRLK